MNIRRQPSNPRAASRRIGVTLIEVMISTVLVSTILLVSLTASANLQRNSRERRNTNSGEELANQFLDEVSAADFRDPSSDIFGLEPDENSADRMTFDDVDDYHGYVSSPPTHRDSTAISGYAGWSLSVTVVPADPDATGITTTTSDARSPLRLIIVDCSAPDGTAVSAGAIVSSVSDDGSDATSHEKWRRIKLTFPNREINVSAPLRNHPETLYPTP